ncbi:Cation diffusion facilitator [Mycena kentingensis (nom. inval.)]|nr:Cation diffusion facilitator [Mycena kentingensis (nom. inval.)]
MASSPSICYVPSPRRRRPAVVSAACDLHQLGRSMIECTPRQLERFRKSKEDIRSIKKRDVRAFYERQNETLDRFAEVEEVLTSKLPDTVFSAFARAPTLIEADEPTPGPRTSTNGDFEEQPLLPESREEKRERAEKIALNVNILVNILLLATKGVAVLLSSSVSLLASFVDSALDFLSTLIIWGASVASSRKDGSTKFLYPTGKKRFEPLGVLIFSVCMVASFTQVLVESLRKLFSSGDGPIGKLSFFGKVTMILTIVVKGVIWFWCAKFQSSAVQALAQDAKNDVFFNIFSLLIPWVGEVLSVKQLDPLGGALLSIYIIIEWIRTLLENFTKLSGKIASSEHHARVLYLVCKFKPVLEISYLEVYHVGDEVIVEVDVILPSSTTLPYAHDVGETIQASIEALDLVSRAYVHIDYSSENPAQHAEYDTRMVDT